MTIEFVGPLVLATVCPGGCATWSPSPAAAGVVLISGALTVPWDELEVPALPAGPGGGRVLGGVHPRSVARTGTRFAQLDGLAIAMAIAAPGGGAAGAGPPPAAPARDALWRGAGIALLSSVLPYSLELIALRRLSAQVFGVLLSLEPAVAALAGLVVLGQRLTRPQLAGPGLRHGRQRPRDGHPRAPDRPPGQ